MYEEAPLNCINIRLVFFLCHSTGDDPNYVTNLANTVDRALSEYDIDLRQCASSIMCKQMKRRGQRLDTVQGKEDGESSSVTDMIGYGLIRQAAK